jgi:hypothetical protein
MSNEKQFLKEYVELCKKHNMELESDDPYCGLGIVPLEDLPNSSKFSPISNSLNYYKVNENVEYLTKEEILEIAQDLAGDYPNSFDWVEKFEDIEKCTLDFIYENDGIHKLALKEKE